MLADEETNFEYLSEMDKLCYLVIYYSDGYCGRLETLPELPNLNALALTDNYENRFKLSAEKEYNFDGIERINLYYFKSVDYDSFKYFKDLHDIEFYELQNDLTREQLDELAENGIGVFLVKLD